MLLEKSVDSVPGFGRCAVTVHTHCREPTQRYSCVNRRQIAARTSNGVRASSGARMERTQPTNLFCRPVLGCSTTYRAGPLSAKRVEGKYHRHTVSVTESGSKT